MERANDLTDEERIDFLLCLVPLGVLESLWDRGYDVYHCDTLLGRPVVYLGEVTFAFNGEFDPDGPYGTDGRYASTLRPIPEEGGQELPCIRCGLRRGYSLVCDELPDPCLGTLPDVIGACCGHSTSRPYVMKADGDVLYDAYAERFFDRFGAGPEHLVR